MGMQLRISYHHHLHHSRSTSTCATTPAFSTSLHPFSSSISFQFRNNFNGRSTIRTIKGRSSPHNYGIVASSNVGAPLWDTWKPDKASPAPSLSDIIWPSAGQSVICINWRELKICDLRMKFIEIIEFFRILFRGICSNGDIGKDR